jgi:hypothetical protein
MLGTFFQFTIFEIEKLENPDFSKQTSESLSPYRGTQTPLILLPIAFLVVLNLYLFIIRFSLIIKIVKISIYLFSIICFALIMQILGAYTLTPLMQNINFILSLVVPTLLLLSGKFRDHLNNILGISLCAITGSFLASYFTKGSILVLLAIISFFDYYFVMRTKQIPKIIKILDKNRIPLALSYASGTAQYQLGFGDLIFATGITVAFFIDGDIISAIRTVILTTISLTVFMFILEEKGNSQPYPAIPAIFVGGLVSAILHLWS